MKKNLLLFSLLIMAVLAWAQQPVVKQVDIKAEQATISALLNKLTTAFKEQDVNTLVALLTEDALILGSDPSEFFNKEQTADIWKEMLAQPFPFDFVGEATIKVAPDAHSAFVVQQYFMPKLSEKIAFRNSYHLIKMNNEWKIFGINTACIPRNEDFPKMNETLNNKG